MKRGLIRALWGFCGDHPFLQRKIRVDRNIQEIANSKFKMPFITYVMGTDNFNTLKSMGFDCVLINENPAPFDPINHKYRNKLEAIKYAMEVDGYDEMVYLDWDCAPKRHMDENFWKILNQKEKIQANLQFYRRPKAFWRNDDQRKISNGGFLYLRDKTIPSKVIKIWEEVGKPDNDEIAWTKYIDDLNGGWVGTEKYFKLFEPLVCGLWHFSLYTKEESNRKEAYFIHSQGGT